MSEGSFWDEIYAERRWPTEPDPLLVASVSELEPGTAVDLGCGTGRHAIWLAGRGWSVTGVDGSSVGLDQARERSERQGLELQLVRAQLEEFRPQEPFDLVLLANIHPEPDRLSALLQHAASMVEPGGHMLILGHHLDDLGRSGPPDPERLYTEARLREALPEGLTVLRLERVERPPSDPGERADVAVVCWLERPAG